MGVKDEIASILGQHKTGLSYHDIMSYFNNFRELQIQIALTEMVDQGTVKEDKNKNGSPIYIPTDNIVPRGFHETFHKLVYTVPEILRGHFPQILLTKDCIRSMINNTQKDITFIVPFLDVWLVEMFEDEVRNLAKRDGKVTIFTRDIKKDSNTLRAGLRLYELFLINSNNIFNLTISNFYLPLTKEGNSRHFSAIHAKIILSDQNAVYVGSANLTRESLSRNIEVGVFSNDISLISEISTLKDIMASVSKPVSLDQLYERSTER